MIYIGIPIPPVFLFIFVLYLRVQNIIFRSLRDGKRPFLVTQERKIRFAGPIGHRVGKHDSLVEKGQNTKHYYVLVPSGRQTLYFGPKHHFLVSFWYRRDEKYRFWSHRDGKLCGNSLSREENQHHFSVPSCFVLRGCSKHYFSVPQGRKTSIFGPTGMKNTVFWYDR